MFVKLLYNAKNVYKIIDLITHSVKLMIDIISLGEFSRNHCIGICTFLVPANLLATLLSLILVVIQPAQKKLLTSVIIAVSFAIILSLHVASWWIIGVIQAPTFILLALSTVCIGLNIWVIIQSKQENPWLSRIVRDYSATRKQSVL